MYLKLRILFTWLSVLCAVAIFPVGTFLGLSAAIVCILVCALFAALMYLCKQKQEQQEAQSQKTQPQNENIAPQNAESNDAPDSDAKTE